MSKDPDALPFYLIYEEAPWQIEARFVHVETHSARSHVHHGDIRRHRHSELHQISFWTKGGGRYFVQHTEQDFSAPAITFIPAGVAHGLRVGPDADAIVTSVADDFFREVIGAGELARAEVLQAAAIIPLTPDKVAEHGLDQAFQSILDEYRRPSLGRADAIAAHLKLALVGVARLRTQPLEAGGRRGQLAGRFRALLEDHFAGWSAPDYAAALSTTDYLLNAAVNEAYGHGILQAIHSRRLLEAKRRLLYSDETVADIAYALGFADPNYFSRFFHRRAGAPPAQWRRRLRASERL